MVLYTYGIVVNYLYMMITDDGTIAENGIFHGFDGSSMQTLAAQSLMGITLSFLFKFLDNIVYVISLTVSMLLTAVFSILFYEFQCSALFLCSMLIVVISIYFFYRQKILERFDWKEREMIF